jgi:hypothetical protein
MSAMEDFCPDKEARLLKALDLLLLRRLRNAWSAVSRLPIRRRRSPSPGGAMSNDEWVATEFELNEMLFVPAGDGAVPLRKLALDNPDPHSEMGVANSATAPTRIARCASMRGSFRHPIR